MDHHEFLAKIDRFLNGSLDPTEHHEFLEHEHLCAECSLALNERQWERLDDLGTLIPPHLRQDGAQ